MSATVQQLVDKIVAEYNLRRRGKGYVGPCPECGGSSRSDKFMIRDDGGFKCYACNFSGDIISWLRSRENMSCPEAHQAAGKNCVNLTCPVYSKCRMGQGHRPRVTRSRRARPSVKPYRAKEKAREVAALRPESPNLRWQSWAEEITIKAHERLLKEDQELVWLGSRGIDIDAVKRFRLGLLQKDLRPLRSKIGLPPDPDGRPNLWVPRGLVIAIFTAGDLVHRIRIRRSLTSRKKFLPDLKYVWLQGSGNMPMVIRPAGQCRGAVIVEAELDGIAAAAAHPEVMVVALGSVSYGLNEQLRKELAAVPVILLALDAEASAVTAVLTWRRTFRHARYWPTPKGKDVGEYFQEGGDLHGWIESGLPTRLKTSQDASFCAVREQTRGEGRVKQQIVKNGPQSGQEVVQVELAAGQTIYVVDDRTEWERLNRENKIVFTVHELDRLQKAFAKMDEEERQAAIMQVVEVKQVFGNAWVARGAVSEKSLQGGIDETNENNS